MEEITKTLHDSQRENIILKGKIRKIECELEDIQKNKQELKETLLEKEGLKEGQQEQHESKMTEEPTPRKQRKTHRKVNEHYDYGNRMQIHLDTTSKYYTKFKIEDN